MNKIVIVAIPTYEAQCDCDWGSDAEPDRGPAIKTARKHRRLVSAQGKRTFTIIFLANVLWLPAKATRHKAARAWPTSCTWPALRPSWG
jgi:hypothetical protein